MRIVKKVITDKTGFSTELYDIATANGKVENLTLRELDFIHSSIKSIVQEIKTEAKS